MGVKFECHLESSMELAGNKRDQFRRDIVTTEKRIQYQQGWIDALIVAQRFMEEHPETEAV